MIDVSTDARGTRTPILRVENVRVVYGRREALSCVSLEVSAGSLALLTGRNGAGKSSVLKAVFGVVAPAEGRIAMRGLDITGSQPHENAFREIAYLAQGGEVFPELTVSENLELARFRLRSGCGATDGLDFFPALGGLMGRPAGLLSGGERQMLALAMCLSREPALLLLDEPTAGLEEGLARRVLERVRKACDATGCAALVAEQNVAEARRVADVEYALAAGKIVSTVCLMQTGGAVQ